MELIRYQPQDTDGSQAIAEKLDALLADFQQFHGNLRKLHWNPRLRPFLDLGQKTAFLHDLTQANTNQLAEHILQMGYTPRVGLELPGTGLAHTRLTQVQAVSSFEGAVFTVIRNSQELLQIIREVFLLAADYQDQQTMRLMTALARQLTLTVQVFASVRMAQLN
ncbi:MAG: hypothetical protein OHK0039_25740 [Bacteroidia bacterium]